MTINIWDNIPYVKVSDLVHAYTYTLKLVGKSDYLVTTRPDPIKWGHCCPHSPYLSSSE